MGNVNDLIFEEDDDEEEEMEVEEEEEISEDDDEEEDDDELNNNNNDDNNDVHNNVNAAAGNVAVEFEGGVAADPRVDEFHLSSQADIVRFNEWNGMK